MNSLSKSVWIVVWTALPLFVAFWASAGHADDKPQKAPVCGSSWVVRSYQVCEKQDPVQGCQADSGCQVVNTTCPIQLPNPDRSQKGQFIQKMELDTEWVKGGQNQQELCRSVERDYNVQNAKYGLYGELTQPTPVSEDNKKNPIGEEQYKYTCRLTINRYPLQTGEKDCQKCAHLEHAEARKGSYEQVLSGLPKDVTRPVCLSCDDMTDQSYEKMARCLADHIDQFVLGDSMSLSQDDLAALRAQVVNLFTIDKVQNFLTTKQATTFAKIMSK